jgi:hypothetical protein
VLLTALRRFSKIAVLCVAIVVTTGIYSALNWLNTPNDLSQTSYGGALILKLLLVALLLAVGFAHHIALRPERYQRWTWLISRISGFMPTLRLEVMLVIPVLVAVGLLSATPIPQPEVSQNEAIVSSATESVNGLMVTQSVIPGAPGINSYETLVLRDGRPMDSENVRIQWVNAARDWRSAWQTAESAGDGLYIAAGAEIDREGMWWLLVDIQDRNETTRAAFGWLITQDAVIVQSRSPGGPHVLSLAAIGGVLLWTAFPTLKRFARWLDWSPQSITIAVLAVIGTIFFSALGYTVLQNNQANYLAQLYPPPQIVNSVLPDADSLTRGEALFAQHCADWDAEGRRNLTTTLHLMRDEEVFAVTVEGWRSLAACEGELSDEQRWDIVNYVRTWERNNE